MSLSEEAAGGASSKKRKRPASVLYRTLTVGDGDFSFSAAMLQKGIQSLYATSYATHAEVLAKYGDAAKANLQAMAADPGVTVRHGVDATDLLSALGDSVEAYLYLHLNVLR